MAIRFLSPKSPLKITSAVYGLLTAVSLVIWFSGMSLRQRDELSISYKTSALEIVQMKRDGQEVRLSLRNATAKPITAFKIDVPRIFWEDGQGIDVFAVYDEILPGATYETTVTLPAQRPKPKKAAQWEADIILRAVLFNDHTGEGDREQAGVMEAFRLGERAQIARNIPMLQKALELPDADLPAALHHLIDQIAASSRDIEATGAMVILRANYSDVFARLQDRFTSEAASGLYFGRERLVKKIRELEQRLITNYDLNLRNEINAILKAYEKNLTIL